MDHYPTWPDRPFTRRDLPGLDRADSDLRRAVRCGEIRQVLRGVYVDTELDDTLELRARAAGLAARPHHVVTDRTAAWVHGVDAYAFAELDAIPPVEVCALRGCEPTTKAGIEARTRDLAPADVMVLHGVRVTTPLRTALDLGCLLRRREVYAVLNEFARKHGITVVELRRALRRYQRRRGVIQLRESIELVDPRVESQRESWTLLAIVDAGLPRPEPQVWVEVDGRPTYRLDLAYPRRRVYVEYDGGEGHSSPEQRAHDRARRRWLRDHGWTVIVVREGDFTGDRLDRWIDEVRAALTPGYSNRRW
jgi:hypothetical protein